MKYMTVQEIRKLWIKFFEENNHYIIEPKSIVPVDDNSILFINSGVSTLKKYFDGSETPPSNRLANVQKALRTNDIENVGVTSRHQTLFEMLGNFSIGDYFKESAIDLAYEFLCSPKWCDIDVDKLYFTVHPDDSVAYDKWIAVGIDPSRIVKLEENFWEIGSGPGGPNSEIFFDRGEAYDERDVLELLKLDLENDRIIEIWNLVFSEFNCEPESKKRHQYDCLPQQNIDTGMGLERIACIMQDVESNFETDEFLKIIKKIEEISNMKYEQHTKAFRIIADHVRALTFAISDSALPSNDGRGYVLRRILRRALRYAYVELDVNEPFLYKLVNEVARVSGQFYENLISSQSYVSEVIKSEEEKFLKTIAKGLNMFHEEIAKTTKEFSGDVAFLLYDTFGFPIEITVELAQIHNINVDLDTFNIRLEEQRTRARENSLDVSAMQKQNPFLKQITVDSEFIGYECDSLDTKIAFITNLHEEFSKIDSGEVYIILEQTPFYANSGGQVGDSGTIAGNEVIDTVKLPNGQHAHLTIITSALEVGQEVSAQIDSERRHKITSNHSATHLLHKALHKYVSSNATQAGSLQDEFKTRFDFASLKPLTDEQISDINAYVNDHINKNHQVDIEYISLEEARNRNILALFGEKYGDIVRVVKMGESVELCGGTHVSCTEQIRFFHIISESGIGSGVRRIEAITNKNVILYHENLVLECEKFISESHAHFASKELISITKVDELLKQAISLKQTIDQGLSELINKLEQLKIQNSEVKKQISQDGDSHINNLTQDLLSRVVVKNDISYIDEFVTDIDVKQLRNVSDNLLNQLNDCVIILKVNNNNKVSVIVAVSEKLTKKVSANDIIKDIVNPHNGRGGGKPSFAQGGYQL